MKLSENFNLEEFITSETAGVRIERISTIQFQLLSKLVNNILQPVRTWYGKPFIITSGIRNSNIIKALKAKGYPVSNNTDHSYADPEINAFGTGAVDFTVNNKHDLLNIYKWIYNNIDNSLIGQLIIYLKKENNIYKYDFIHVSNSTNVLKEIIEEQRNKIKFLMRKDDHYIDIDFAFLEKEVK